jgi:hypothetical protein
MIIGEHSESEFKRYLSPLSTALGINMTSTFASNAVAKKLPHFEVSINIMSTAIPENQAKFKDDLGIRHPTIFGPQKLAGSNINGSDLNRLEFPSIQFNIGLISSIELVFRYTNWELERIGSIELRGVGIKYELIEIPLAIDQSVYISLMANYQNLQLESFIESAAFGMTINISKSFVIIPLEIIGGIRYANNILTFDSSKIRTNASVGSVNVDGINGLVYQIGIGYRLFFSHFFADYNIGPYNAFSAGLGFEF